MAKPQAAATPKGATKNEIAKATSTAVGAALDFSGDSGKGMENTTSDSFAIPFLSVLQKGSPQVDEASGVSLEGAKQGMFFENINSRMFEGTKVGVQLVPVYYRRVFIRWAPKGSEGSGFKGELTPEQVLAHREKREIVEMDGKLYFPLPDGSVNEKKCDRVADTRNHYVLLMNEDESWTECLLSLTSTQIKKSKMLMSALASVKLKGASGMYTPPTFANVIKATTIPESNDKGNWMGIRFEVLGQVDRPDLYQAAKKFHEVIKAGKVEARYEDVDAGPAEPEAGKAGGSF